MSRQAAVLTVIGSMILFVAAGLAGDKPASRAAPTTQPAGRPPRPHRWERASEGEVLEMLKSRLPMRYERLVRLKDSDPKGYAFYMDRMRDWYEQWKKLPPPVQDAEITGQLLRVKIWQIVAKLHQQTSEEAKNALEKELSEAVAKQVQAECTVMEHRLKLLEADLARMRDRLKDRLENREQFVADRVERLLRVTTQPARRSWHGPRPERDN